MLFSTNSAMALSGLAWDRAMIRMAFQSSPILSLPLSDSFDLAALVFATMARSPRGCLEGKVNCSRPAFSHYIEERGSRARVARRPADDVGSAYRPVLRSDGVKSRSLEPTNAPSYNSAAELKLKSAGGEVDSAEFSGFGNSAALS